MDKNSPIFIAGHTGMVGQAIMRNLAKKGFTNIITKTRKELDLLDQYAVARFFTEAKPEYVFLAAAKVGGIIGNKTKPAEFIYENLTIITNIIHSAHNSNVKKLLFLGSSCIYPKFAQQPIEESRLLTGELEPTNQYYAIAKIAGIKMCEAYRKQYGDNFISVMPTNLYGPGDSYDLQTSHVIPALLRKFHEAKESDSPSVSIWGTGTPRREFLHADDLADACVYLMQNYDEEGHINIGTGEDISIRELAELVKGIVGYRGEILYDTEKPDGTPRKLLNVSKLKEKGWSYSISLKEGLSSTYEQFKTEFAQGKLRGY